MIDSSSRGLFRKQCLLEHSMYNLLPPFRKYDNLTDSGQPIDFLSFCLICIKTLLFEQCFVGLHLILCIIVFFLLTRLCCPLFLLFQLN